MNLKIHQPTPKRPIHREYTPDPNHDPWIEANEEGIWLHVLNGQGNPETLRLCLSLDIHPHADALYMWLKQQLLAQEK